MFLNIEEAQISNILFKSCELLSFMEGRNIDVANVTIEQGEISISNWRLYNSMLCTNYTIHLYNLNIISNSTGIIYTGVNNNYYDTTNDCTHIYLLYLQNCTLNMANIYVAAYCTQIYIQQLTIKQINRPVDYDHHALYIFVALKVSVSDFSIEDSTTPLSLIEFAKCSVVELKGHILFQGNKNSIKIAYIDGIQHLKIFPHTKIEFYGNSGIRESLLELYHPANIASAGKYHGKVYIGEHQYTNTSLLFKNNEVTYGGSIMVIKTLNDSPRLTDSPRVIVHNSKFTFENNIILYDGGYDVIMAILLIFQSKVSFTNTSFLFVNNSVPAGGIFVMVNSELLIDGNLYMKFENNEGSDGGAMTLSKQSFIEKDHINLVSIANASAHFIFNNNLAHKRGGAIFVEDVH